jgi:hypothetical protein
MIIYGDDGKYEIPDNLSKKILNSECSFVIVLFKADIYNIIIINKKSKDIIFFCPHG